MTSLLDVWDELPESERRILTKSKAIYEIAQLALAEYVINSLIESRLQKYYSIIFKANGRFTGIQCRSCSNQLHDEHALWCPMAEIEDGTRNADYVAAFLSDLELLERPPDGWQTITRKGDCGEV